MACRLRPGGGRNWLAAPYATLIEQDLKRCDRSHQANLDTSVRLGNALRTKEMNALHTEFTS